MKYTKSLLTAFAVLFLFAAQAQSPVDSVTIIHPDDFPAMSSLDSQYFQFFSLKDTFKRKADIYTVKRFMLPQWYVTWLPYDIDPATDTSGIVAAYRGYFVKDIDGQVFYVDALGNTKLISDPGAFQDLDWNGVTFQLSLTGSDSIVDLSPLYSIDSTSVANIGDGEGIFYQLSGNEIQLKTLKVSGGTISSTDSTITITAGSGGLNGIYGGGGAIPTGGTDVDLGAEHFIMAGDDSQALIRMYVSELDNTAPGSQQGELRIEGKKAQIKTIDDSRITAVDTYQDSIVLAFRDADTNWDRSLVVDSIGVLITDSYYYPGKSSALLDIDGTGTTVGADSIIRIRGLVENDTTASWVLAMTDSGFLYFRPDTSFTAGIDSIYTDATLDGLGTLADPLKIAQQAATTGQVLKWNGSTWLPDNDATGGTQTVDTFSLAGTVLTLTLENDGEAPYTVDLGPISGSPQTVDSLILTGTVLTLALENDGEAPYTVDLASLDTDDQTVDTFSLAGTILTLALEGDGEAPYTVDLAGLSSDNQTVDSLILTGTDGLTLLLALENDGEAPYTRDLGEPIEDHLGNTFLQEGTNITLTYNDIANSLEISAVGDGTGTDDQNLSVTAGTSTTSVIDIENGNDVTIAVTGGLAISEAGSTITLDGSGVAGTDDQTVDTLSLAGTILTLALEGDGEAPYTVDLAGLQDGTGTDDQNLSVGAGTGTTSLIQIEDGTGITLEAGANITLSEVGSTITITGSGSSDTDDQTVDTFSLAGTILTLALEDDGEAPYTVDLASLQDGTGTDDQTLSWNVGTGELSIESGNTVDLDGRYLQAEVDGSVTNELQTVDTFSLTGTTLTLALEGDGEAPYTVDLASLPGATGDDLGSHVATASLNMDGNGIDSIALAEFANTDLDVENWAIFEKNTGEIWVQPSGGTAPALSMTDEAAGRVVKISNAYTLPNSEGVDGQVLTATGAGSAVWEDVPGITDEAYGEEWINGTPDVLSVTSGTPVKVDGTTAGDMHRFTHTTGRLTYAGPSATFSISLVTDVQADISGVDVIAWIYKNGAEISETERGEYMEEANAAENISTGCITNLDSLDFIEVFLDASENAGLQVNYMNLSAFKLGSSIATGIDTDDQTVDSFFIKNDTLWLTLEDDGEAPYGVNISSLINTDDQTVDTFSLAGTVLTLALEDDGEAPYTVDLAGLQDGTGTDDQNLSVGAGTGTTSLIQIEDGTGITLEAGANITLNEVGSTILISATGDGTGTDDQNLSVTAGTSTTSVIDIENGNDVTLAVTGGLAISEAGSTITLDGSGITGTGDDLGNHQATENLDMNQWDIQELDTLEFFDGSAKWKWWIEGSGGSLMLTYGEDETQATYPIRVSDFGSVRFGGTDGYDFPTAAGTVGQYMTYDGSGALAFAGPVQHIKGVSVQSPTSTENITLFFVDHAVTVKKVAEVVQGTTPSVTYNIRHASTRTSGTPNSVFASNRAVTSTSGTTTTTFSDATIPANSWVWIITSATSGTVNEFHITIDYEQD